MTPEVSIAIPAYKSAFLRQAIDSVLAQTYAGWELIIVNDASPEPISEIVGEYADPRIRYYVNEANIGAADPAANWNRCLRYARGKFFALLCDDDTYGPRFIQTMLDLAARYPGCPVFRARGQVVDAQGSVLTYYPSSPDWEPCEEYMWHIYSGLRSQTISEFLYRTAHIRSKGGFASFPMAWSADRFSVFVFSREGGIASSREILMSFRRSGINISTKRKFVREKIRAQKMHTARVIEFLNGTSFALKDTIIGLRLRDERVWLADYLAAASLRDFIYLWIHRRSGRYGIPARCFVKAVNVRLGNLVKRVLK